MKNAHWKTLDPAKILAGLTIVADAQGRVLETVRNRTEEDLGYAFIPYFAFANLTLACGAFGYKINKDPTEAEEFEVVIDFLRAIGEADASDEIKLRTAIIGDSEEAKILRETRR